MVAAVAFAAVRLTGGGGGTPRVEVSGVAGIDAGSGRPTSFKSTGRTPSNIAVGEDAVWVLDGDDRTISRIDPQSGDVEPFSPGTTPTDIAVGDGVLWVGNLHERYTGSISKIDPASHRETRKLTLLRPLPGHEPGLARAGGQPARRRRGLALGDQSRRDGLPLRRRHGKADSDHRSDEATLHVGVGGVWIVGAEPSVTRIDPKNNEPGESIPVVAAGLVGIATGAGSVWAAAPDEGVVWRIEPGGQRVPIPVGPGVMAVAFGEGALWAANYADGTIARIDPATNKVTAIQMHGNLQGIAAGEGSAWVSVVGGTTAGPLPTSICGQPEASGKRPDVLIASDFPLQGVQADSGARLVDAIRFVLRRHEFRAGSYAVGYQPCDDATAQVGSFSDVKCMSNARAYGAAEDVVAVIGPLNSTALGGKLRSRTGRQTAPCRSSTPRTHTRA